MARHRSALHLWLTNPTSLPSSPDCTRHSSKILIRIYLIERYSCLSSHLLQVAWGLCAPQSFSSPPQDFLSVFPGIIIEDAYESSELFQEKVDYYRLKVPQIRYSKSYNIGKLYRIFKRYTKYNIFRLNFPLAC